MRKGGQFMKWATFERRMRDPDHVLKWKEFLASLNGEWKPFSTAKRRGLLGAQSRIVKAEGRVSKARKARPAVRTRVALAQAEEMQAAFEKLLEAREDLLDGWQRLWDQQRNPPETLSHPTSCQWSRDEIETLRGHIARTRTNISSMQNLRDELGTRATLVLTEEEKRAEEGDAHHVRESSHMTTLLDAGAWAPPEARCVGGWKLGEGGFGSVGLWMRQDMHGRVSDRTACKDTYMEEDHWANEFYWRGNFDDIVNRVPTEVDAMLALRDKPGSSSIVRIRNYRVYNKKHMYRIVMEVCPFGTMEWVRRSYEKNAKAKVPEPFPWYLSGSLVEAALLMEKGALDVALPDWDSIIHRDMKPENILSAGYSDTHFAVYPTPTLSDFGLAIRPTEALDANLNPHGVNGGTGSRGFIAPEQSAGAFDRTGGHPEPRLQSSTNVWGIGITLLSIMNLDGRPPEQTYQDNDDPAPPDFNKNGERYSDALKNMVRECLEADPAARADLDGLRVVIDDCTRPPPDNSQAGSDTVAANEGDEAGAGPAENFDEANGMRFSAPEDRRDHLHALLVKDDAWPMDEFIKTALCGGRFIASPVPSEGWEPEDGDSDEDDSASDSDGKH
ncbi:hypothetical protein LTR85_005581 [Meristemomyces frigidus]|nr:hypothetical protein LTR85_005581 [Meristemomyces frigidus]